MIALSFQQYLAIFFTKIQLYLTTQIKFGKIPKLEILRLRPEGNNVGNNSFVGW